MDYQDFSMTAFIVTWLAASVRLAGPLLLTALGEIFDELAGVLNVGIEGTLLIGAVTSFLVAFLSGSPWLGLAAAIMAGIAVNLFLAWMYVDVQASQIVVGIIFNTLAIGIASYAYRLFLGGQAVVQQAPMLREINIPVLSELPYIGTILFKHSILLYITLGLMLISGFILYRTKFGLKLRSVGEHPRAADTAGINVRQIRYIGVLASGATAGMAGGYLILSQLGMFRDNIVVGQGFIALAIVIFGRWNPFKAALAALAFGAATALQLSLQIFAFNIPPQILLSLPYLLTILAMSGLLGKATQPAELLVPYKKE